MEERPALKVERMRAEEVRKRLRALGLLDSRYRPRVEGGYVLFPIVEGRDTARICRELGCEPTRAFFERRFTKPRTLREALKDTVPRNLHQFIPSSFDLIGSVAVIEIPPGLRHYERVIGEALMEVYPRVETVLAKEGGTHGAYRIRGLRVIAGTGRTETIYREHGCIYYLDMMKTFFNPRMSGERIRVASQVKPGEYVVDMFAGVGPFAVLIARRQPSARVLAVEINPDAYRFLVRNIQENGVSGRVEAMGGDVRQVLRDVEDRFDRAIMDLPFSAINYLDLALKATKERAMIHLYHVEEGEDASEKAVEKAIRESERHGFKVEVKAVREVMEVAPKRFIIALDLVKSG